MFTLITAAASSKAYQLTNKLLSKENIIFADSEDLPEIMLRGKRFIKILKGNSASFAHLLLSTCLDQQITKVFPLRKAEVYALIEARQLFDEYNICVMVPELSKLDKFLGNDLKGELIISEDLINFDGELLRGAFVKNNAGEYQLFTAD